MTQITVFGDIHANLPALEAVLADMEARGLANLSRRLRRRASGAGH